jgi:hypothetical protein
MKAEVKGWGDARERFAVVVVYRFREGIIRFLRPFRADRFAIENPGRCPGLASGRPLAWGASVSVVAGLLALGLGGCETTGNPREGGLFGWSEAKARQRQAERRSEVAAAEAKVNAEQRRSAQLQTSRKAGASRVEQASTENARVSATLRAREEAVALKAAKLEEESPTAATASRARKLRMQVDAVAGDRSLSEAERARQLHELEAEIDAARAGLKR